MKYLVDRKLATAIYELAECRSLSARRLNSWFRTGLIPSVELDKQHLSGPGVLSLRVLAGLEADRQNFEELQGGLFCLGWLSESTVTAARKLWLTPFVKLFGVVARHDIGSKADAVALFKAVYPFTRRSASENRRLAYSMSHLPSARQVVAVAREYAEEPAYLMEELRYQLGVEPIIPGAENVDWETLETVLGQAFKFSNSINLPMLKVLYGKHEGHGLPLPFDNRFSSNALPTFSEALHLAAKDWFDQRVQ